MTRTKQVPTTVKKVEKSKKSVSRKTSRASKKTPSIPTPHKKRRRKNRVRREIRYLQNSAHPIIKSGPFKRIIRSILAEKGHEFRIKKEALYMLRQTIEHEVLQYLKRANILCTHGKRKIVSGSDLRMSIQMVV